MGWMVSGAARSVVRVRGEGCGEGRGRVMAQRRRERQTDRPHAPADAPPRAGCQVLGCGVLGCGVLGCGVLGSGVIPSAAGGWGRREVGGGAHLCVASHMVGAEPIDWP